MKSRPIGPLFITVFLIFIRLAHAEFDWKWISPQIQTNALRAIIYGNNQWLAVGDFGTIASSPDGLSWTTQKSGTNADLTGITWSGTQYLAVGDSGTLLASVDGTHWAKKLFPQDSKIFSVIFFQSKFFITAMSTQDSLTVYSSPDGENWTRKSLNTGVTPASGTLIFTPSMIFIVGPVARFFSSSDGTNWNICEVPQSPEIYTVMRIGNTFIARGDGGIWGNSTDGLIWKNEGAANGVRICASAANDNIGVVVGDKYSINSTNDGHNWLNHNLKNEISDPLASTIFYAVATDGVRFVAVGKRGIICYSPDGLIWRDIRQFISGTHFNKVRSGGGETVVLGDTAILAISQNSNDWNRPKIEIKNSIQQVINDIAISGHLSIATGYQIDYQNESKPWVLTSTDGTIWNSFFPDSTLFLDQPTWIGNQFLAWCTGGFFATSTDGKNWNKQNRRMTVNMVDNGLGIPSFT